MGTFLLSCFTLKHGLRVVLHTTFCFLFYSFFDEIYVCKHNFSGHSKRASTFLTDCWATLTVIDKHYALVICYHGTQPRRGRAIDPCFRFFNCLRSAEEITGVCLIYVNMAAILSLKLKCSYDMFQQYLKDKTCLRTEVCCKICFMTKTCYKTLCETSC